MKKNVGCWAVCLLVCNVAFSQVDTAFVYNTTTPYGTLDIRLAKSSSRYYYLQENKTFSFRETSPGVKTETFRDMTSWDSSPYSQGNMREKNGNADYFIMNYRLLFPVNYNSGYSEGYPLIVMMHGAGERGNCWDASCFWDTRSWRPMANTPAAPTTSTHELLNNDYNLVHGGNVHLKARNSAGTRLPNDPNLPERAFPGFVLFPQNLNGWDTFTAQDAIKLIRLISKKYKVNPDRIYLHGLSNGGIGTYEVLKRAPWLFAAALPMSAPTEASIITKGLKPRIAHVPLWIFQGGLDVAPKPARTRGYVKSFQDAGAIVRYTEYSHLGHGVWNTAYGEPDFFSWMLKKNKANIHLFAGVSTICESNGQGVRMELAAGFHSYQWEFNGSIITGANAASYVANSPGTYRARFSRKKNPDTSDWNRWSDPVQVTSQNVAEPKIVQTGTVVLKGLDGYNYARLKAEGIYSHYYWYKNNVLLNLPGSQDDTTRMVKISAGDCSSGTCSGNGVYTLMVAGPDNCPSPVSQPKYIFFNDQAPINITAPTNFSATSLSNARVNLTWNDASSNENGFEIWRRRKTGTSSFSKWEMAPITPPNVTGMVDQGLYPSTTYHYKIRAVGNAGRSYYTPAAVTQYIVVTTSGDIENPTPPQNLTAISSGIREIKMNWQASTDNTGIREYIIYYGTQSISTGSSATSYTLTNLPLNTDFTFTVKGMDLGNNLSEASNAAMGNTFVNGLFYEHSTGVFSDIDLINWSVAEYKGPIDNFTLSPRRQEDFFNFQFKGYLYINTGGSYQFQTYSDDGSRVTIDDVMVVDNDGRHTPKTVTGTAVNLASGPRLINVKYFEYMNGQNLVVRYKGPDTGNTWLAIPDEALRSGSTVSTTSMMTTTKGSPEAIKSPVATTETLVTDQTLRMEIFPNPSRQSDPFTIQVLGNQYPVNIKLLDTMGKLYYENTVSAEDSGEGFQIQTRDQLMMGVYIIFIKQGNQTLMRKVVVKD